MAHEGPLIDWNAFGEASRGGRFMELFVKLPRELWAERDENGYTLLHHACFGPNVAAVVELLQSGLVDYAASTKQPRVLEALCAADVDLRALTRDGSAPIDGALRNAYKDDGETLRVLVANGVRLSTVNKACYKFTMPERACKLITPELEAFERGVLCCRAAVVAMLRVKRAGQLWMWDKFLLLEMAVCIWATRYDKGWQIAAQQQEPMLPPQ